MTLKPNFKNTLLEKLIYWILTFECNYLTVANDTFNKHAIVNTWFYLNGNRRFDWSVEIPTDLLDKLLLMRPRSYHATQRRYYSQDLVTNQSLSFFCVFIKFTFVYGCAGWTNRRATLWFGQRTLAHGIGALKLQQKKTEFVNFLLDKNCSHPGKQINWNDIGTQF